VIPIVLMNGLCLSAATTGSSGMCAALGSDHLHAVAAYVCWQLLMTCYDYVVCAGHAVMASLAINAHGDGVLRCIGFWSNQWPKQVEASTFFALLHAGKVVVYTSTV
jgi:hypothetical protein